MARFHRYVWKLREQITLESTASQNDKLVTDGRLVDST